MNKQEFESRIRNSTNAAELKTLILERMDTVNEEFAPHGSTSVFETAIRTAIHKLHYEALYNTLPSELKELVDKLIRDSVTVIIAKDSKETR